MNKKPNHRCRICGVEYYACNDCASQIRANYGAEPWRAIAESPVHYQIYITLVLFARNELSAVEALQQLNHIGIDDLDTFLPSYQSLIRKIIADVTGKNEVASSLEASSGSELGAKKKISSPKSRSAKKVAPSADTIDE